MLPPLAALSRAFQKQDIHFSIVKPLVSGTKATIEALLLTPGEFFQSLPSALVSLSEYSVQQPSDEMAATFKRNVYDKYLNILGNDITERFPDVNLLESFDIFNPASIPLDLSLQPSHGSDGLDVLLAKYSPEVVASESTKGELKNFQ